MRTCDRRLFTPETMGMSREKIIEHVCALAPGQADYIREYMGQPWNRYDWPVIEGEWTDEFVCAFGEWPRPLVEIKRRLSFERIAPTWRLP